LLNTTASYEPDNLIVGHEVPALTFGVIVEKGQGILKKGSVLGTISSNKNKKLCDSTSEDGSEVAKFVLSEQIDTSSENVCAVVYKSGIFNKNKLIFGGNDSAEDHRAELRDLNIHIKETLY